MTDPDPSDSVVGRMLAAAGLAPTDEERAFFELVYPVLRARADMVYLVEQELEL